MRSGNYSNCDFCGVSLMCTTKVSFSLSFIRYDWLHALASSNRLSQPNIQDICQEKSTVYYWRWCKFSKDICFLTFHICLILFQNKKQGLRNWVCDVFHTCKADTEDIMGPFYTYVPQKFRYKFKHEQNQKHQKAQTLEKQIMEL